MGLLLLASWTQNLEKIIICSEYFYKAKYIERKENLRDN